MSIATPTFTALATAPTGPATAAAIEVAAIEVAAIEAAAIEAAATAAVIGAGVIAGAGAAATTAAERLPGNPGAAHDVPERCGPCARPISTAVLSARGFALAPFRHHGWFIAALLTLQVLPVFYITLYRARQPADKAAVAA
jgi:hypothetical protein